MAWRKDQPFGAEFAQLDLRARSMSANGRAIGSEPCPYLMEYRLETGDDFVTRQLHVSTAGEGWRRTVLVERHQSGRWTASDGVEGEPPFEVLAHDLDGLAGAVDCDLGLSPLTNTMPVLRHRLLQRAGEADLTVAWISVPDLVVHRERQRYTSEPQKRGDVVRFESLDDSFVADITFDDDGVVVDYPGIARRL